MQDTKFNPLDAKKAGDVDVLAISAAARALEAGNLVAFPTETVYGLGADAENPEAIHQIYTVKGRPANHPVIVHLAPGAKLEYWAKNIPQEAHQLINAFWPGPLTLILERADHIPDAVSGGQATIGLRCPSHPVAQALLSSFKSGKGGIAAPSANKFGHVSPTLAKHVMDEFATEVAQGQIYSVLEGGQSEVGIESSILDLSRLATRGPVMLRPGHVSAQAIEAVLHMTVRQPFSDTGMNQSTNADDTAPRVSGSLDAHYAPHTPVILVASQSFDVIRTRLQSLGKQVVCMRISAVTASAVSTQDVIMSNQAQAYAHALYAALRQLDLCGADVILVEAPPVAADWQGVNDRLSRAAFDSRALLAQWLDAAEN